MGTCNSPAGSGRYGSAFVRFIAESGVLFRGTAVDNILPGFILRRVFDLNLGEGRVLLDTNGDPCLLLWLHDDDYFLHGPTFGKVAAGLTHISWMRWSAGFGVPKEEDSSAEPILSNSVASTMTLVRFPLSVSRRTRFLGVSL